MYKVKNNKKIKLLIIALTILLTFLSSNVVLATTLSSNSLQQMEYSEEYKKWLDLPEEERNKVMMPNMYDIEIKTDDSEYLNNITNVFKLNKLLTATASSNTSKFDLREVIGSNLKIKDQGQTGGCWAFAMVAALETHFAREDKVNGQVAEAYDFSERHMVYATVREAFLNNAINEKGFSKEISGGNSLVAQAYMTNGSGAIKESGMPFENNEDKINIAQIQNKDVVTTLIDGEILGSPNTQEERNAVIQDIKEHISEKGGVWASLHGAELISNGYNNATAALYTNNKITYPMNHAILIVGWDDEYEKENFNEAMRPQNDGAWIIKNSWGEKIEIEIPEGTPEATIQEAERSYKNKYGTDKVQVVNNKLTITVGDNGFMYVSYEDVNIMNNLYKIVEAKNYEDYDTIYQYDYLGINNQLYLTIPSTITKGYMANVFETKSNNEELTKVSISTLMPYEKCRVYVNPKGSSINYQDLQLVDLAEGEYEKLEAGYNTIEFANPIKITGKSFAIVLELSIDEKGRFYMPVNMPESGSYWEDVKVVKDMSFVTLEGDIEKDTWINVTEEEECGVETNLTIKAFTNEIKEEVVSLSSIEIEKAPSKTTYNVGDKFDRTGMIINAVYTNGTKKAVTNYMVTNGDSLELNQKSVTISYTENGITKTITQAITVNKPEPTLTKIEVKQKPTKLEYIQNQDELNLQGGIITATYSDGDTKNIEMTNSEVKASGYDKTKVGKQIITLTYEEKVTTFEVTVKEKETETNPEETPEPTPKPTPEQTPEPDPDPEVTLTKIEIKEKPTKLEYTQNKDELNLAGGIITATYSDNSTEDILMTNSKVKVTGYDKTKVGKQTITVTYEGKTVTFEITVKEVQKRTPTLSSFKAAKANMTKATSYIYIKKDKTQYSTMTIKLDGIEKGDKDSTREFYYYLSGKKGESSITDSNWTKFDMTSSGEKYSANINIDTRNVKNASEIAESESLYVYIKEVAKLDGNTTETVNIINVKKVVDVEVYLDDVKQSDLNMGGTGNSSSSETSKDNQGDDTVAKEPIPQTGVITVGIVIIAILAVGILSYIRYRNIDK